MRHAHPTQRVGDTTLIKSLVISTGFCRLSALMGFNNGAAAYLMIFNTAAVPAGGSKGAFSFPIDAARAYAFAMPNLVEMDACCAAVSSTPDTYTDPGGTPITLQAILAV